MIFALSSNDLKYFRNISINKVMVIKGKIVL